MPIKKFANNGRPATAVTVAQRLCSPAETVITHRLRLVVVPENDVLDQGTQVRTLEELYRDLQSPYTVTKTFQSRDSDLLYEAVSKFGRLECSDPRDKLYGLLGILSERSRVRVGPDYTKDVGYAFRQALNIGLEEIYHGHGTLARSNQQGDLGSEYLGYFCDARDAFGIAEPESISILRHVLNELDFHPIFEDAMAEVQWQQQFVWSGTLPKVLPGFQQLLAYARENAKPEEEWPFRFQIWQRRMVEKLVALCFSTKHTKYGLLSRE